MQNTDNLGKNPVAIVGAGFTIATLSKSPPSTNDIIVRTIDSSHAELFPILQHLYHKVPKACLELNKIWSHVDYYSEMLNIDRYEIYKKYLNINKEIISNYFKNRVNAENFIPTMLGLELKRMIALKMSSKAMKDSKNDLSSHVRDLIDCKNTEK